MKYQKTVSRSLLPCLLTLAVLATAGAAQRRTRPRLMLEPVRDVQEKEGIRVRKAEASTPVEDARLRITSPAGNALLPANQDVAVSIDLSGFTLGEQTAGPRAGEVLNSAQGQHLHVIVDNDPYLEFFDASKPLPLGRLTEGGHTIRAFPARSYHESVKSPRAFAVQNLHVGTRGAQLVRPRDQILTYSMPRGQYTGKDAERILVDFYVTNARLGDGGYKVRLTVDGQPFLLTEWTPYYIEGLKPGKHTVKLELLNPKGEVTFGAFNTSLRTITVK